jgi:hypothetical protein
MTRLNGRGFRLAHVMDFGWLNGRGLRLGRSTVLTVQIGQVEWYSEGEAAAFSGSASAVQELRPVTVLLRQGSPRQPEAPEIEMFLKDSTRQRVLGNGEGRGERVWIYGFGR